MNDTKQQDDGGPAFPVAGHAGENPELTAYGKLGHPGMSLRDWFAGMALQSLISEDPKKTHALDNPGGRTWDDWVAMNAYGIADAMIEARKGDQP